MTARYTDRELLARLVAFDTVSRNSNVPMADFIADYVDRPGVRVHRNTNADGTKVNLVAVGGPEDRTDAGLTLCGHMDVVPAHEVEWNSDPFQLTERDGGLYGRGACDMKGFLSLAINRFAALDSTQLHRPLALLLTHDEECGMTGARNFVDSWAGPALPPEVLIGEPTALRVVTMHKGFLELRITLRGVGAHSGYPHLGNSAIEPAGPLITALTALQHEMACERPPFGDRFPEVPFVALNIGRVTGGTAINMVPDRCVIELGIRILPEMKSDTVLDRVRDTVTRSLGDRPFALDVISDSPPMWLDEDSPLAAHLKCDVGQTRSHTVGYATDGGWLQTAGFRCVIFGPGDIEVAHKPNEFIPIEALARGGMLLDGIIERHITTPREGNDTMTRLR